MSSQIEPADIFFLAGGPEINQMPELFVSKSRFKRISSRLQGSQQRENACSNKIKSVREAMFTI
jgi:hypothetical protein